MVDIAAALALTRLGLGARPEEWAQVARDPEAWTTAAIGVRDAALIREATLPDAATSYRMQLEYRNRRREAAAAAFGARPGSRPRPPSPAVPPVASADDLAGARAADVPPERALDFVAGGAMLLGPEIVARTAAALDAPYPFAERWALFWANHFTVSAGKAASLALAGPFEREAIRPHIWDSFATLLRHAATHQGMLAWLDQSGSIGPNSVFGQRRERGLNENLAREILELHTLGVNGGYNQADVTEFAKALTGWTVIAPRLQDGLKRFGINAAIGEARFLDPLHEPGSRVILGKTYAQAGEMQSRAILDDLARHPSTAQFIARKLARHFSSDDPPAALVSRLAQDFSATRGDLASLAKTLLASPEIRNRTQMKFKQPYEFLVSSLRAAGIRGAELRLPELRRSFDLLGQPALRAPGPRGWPDEAAAWAGPDAVIRRVEFAEILADRIGGRIAPMKFLEDALRPLAGDRLRQAVAGTESARQAIVLVLMSPEFQRR